MLKTRQLIFLAALTLAWAGNITADDVPTTRMVAPPADSLSPVAHSASLDTGRSVLNKEISVFRFEGTGPEKVIIVGGIHGNEPQSVVFAEALVDSLNTLEPTTMAKTLIVIPLLNPDGFELKTRKNARGIDLNRNFPALDFSVGYPKSKYYGGDKAGSEPETRFMLDLLKREKPDLLIMLHTPYNLVNSDGDSLGLGPRLAETLGLKYLAEMAYSTPGAAGSYFGREGRLPVLTVEFPARDDVWKRFGVKFLRFLLASE
ncbi:MAG: DUF2817 domain-containing protein [Candidatus Cloacimonetes bacterium]|nr:DUF2817 domain-containing protein [Candidatus Cloacimonadota bacterium]